jgi:hypothetical protein
MMIGRIDEVDGHFVATRFLALAVPTACVYVAREKSDLKNGVRILTDWRSIMLGYGRVWAPLIAIALPLGQALAGHGIPIVTWVLSAALLGVCVLSYRSGKLPEREKARLRLLGTVTGLRIDPSRLQPAMREVKRDSLGELMEKGGIPTTPDGIISVLDDIPMPAMPLVYGYACYAGDDPIWQNCAAQVYERHEQGEI